MKHLDLFQHANNITSRFSSILQEDRALDCAYSDNKADIENKYKQRLAESESKKAQRISGAFSKNQTAQTNIKNALFALSKLEVIVPAKYKNKYRPTGLSPELPDFQLLDELADRISDISLTGMVKRFTGIGGYSSKADMMNDYLNHIEAGILYLRREQQKSSDYLTQENAAADAEYDRDKAMADQEKNSLMNQNDQKYARDSNALRNKFLAAIDDPDLLQFDADLTDALKQLGGFDDTWGSYEPSLSYPDELMIGAITIPLSIPSPADQMIREKMPVAFSSGRGFCVPMTVKMSQPLQLLINYDDRCKNEVMEGIQSIILKWIRFMPPYSFTLTYIDPIERGSNLKQLQKLEEITTWNICKKVYASRDDITKQLKELEKFVDATCSRLAGVGSAYEYNMNNETVIVQQLVVINDFPEKIDRAAEESLDVLIHNAAKCGISMIFTKKGDLSKLPDAVQNSFLKINASVNGHTIPFEGKMYDFLFDNVCSTCETFIECVKAKYNEIYKVDNRFANYFSLTTFNGYRESTESLLIPFAVDSRKRLVELELGGALSAHALLSGNTGSGKSNTLKMIITSIILNYHPDDVELWLVDYHKVEFAGYISNMPPHVKLIGLEQSAEFTFSLLEKIDEECMRRMELFKRVDVSDITEYKRKFGVRSLPRIILIIDEFHKMTQTIKDEPEYVIILENILSESRKFGISCLFSDQAISVGLRGLTDKGKKQIGTRIAMHNDKDEIKETLSTDNSFYDNTLNYKITHMIPGDVIFKREIIDASGETQIFYDRYRAVFATREERIKSIEFVKRNLESTYSKPDVLVVDGKSRKYCDNSEIEKYEAANGGPTQSDIPIYVGTPVNLNPCFCFTLQDKMDSNIMVIGADTDMRASIVLYTIFCFSRLSKHEIVVLADKRDELYKQYGSEPEKLTNVNIHIKTEPEEICAYVNGLLDDARNGKQPKTLLVWLGIESIGNNLSTYDGKPVSPVSKKDISNNPVIDLMHKYDSILAELKQTDANETESDAGSKETTNSPVYDARDDISELISRGSYFGIHSLVTYSSVKMLRQSRFVKLDCFEHKIAFAMSRDDWSNYMEGIRYITDLDSISAVYYDGGSATHIFRPYLIK